jgi:hypothetical protein
MTWSGMHWDTKSLPPAVTTVIGCAIAQHLTPYFSTKSLEMNEVVAPVSNKTFTGISKDA